MGKVSRQVEAAYIATIQDLTELICDGDEQLIKYEVDGKINEFISRKTKLINDFINFHKTGGFYKNERQQQ